MLITYRGSAFICSTSYWALGRRCLWWSHDSPLGCPCQVSTGLWVGPWLISDQWSWAKDGPVTCAWLHYTAFQHLSFSLLLALQKRCYAVGCPCGKKIRAASSSSRQQLMKTFSIAVVVSEFFQKKQKGRPFSHGDPSTGWHLYPNLWDPSRGPRQAIGTPPDSQTLGDVGYLLC